MDFRDTLCPCSYGHFRLSSADPKLVGVQFVLVRNDLEAGTAALHGALIAAPHGS